MSGRSDWCAHGHHPACPYDGCACACHESGSTARVLRVGDGIIGGKKTAPGGASTPNSRGLADDWSID